MGVLECNRAGCDSIMCDNYNSHHGYLCNSCKTELKDNPMMIDIFMKTPKLEKGFDKEGWDWYIDTVFSNQGIG